MWQELRRRFFSVTRTRALPARVQRVIEEQQAQSERIIAWAHLLIVAVFAALYTFTPKGFSGDVMLEPVPYVLAIYFAFAAIRYLIVRRARPAGWFIALATIAEVTLLMLLIWSYHLQYEQPPGFYLRATTLLYVFIFIALGALRFEARYVVLAGVAALAGWLVLVLYALREAMVGDLITRDFVEYTLTHKLLIGAEIDKMIPIALVTLIVAVVILRARSLLVRSAKEAAAAAELSRFFAPEVALAITGSAEPLRPGEGELRDAAILHCDIQGFTRLSRQLSPNDLMRLLADYEARMVPVIQGHGGSVDKFIGDGILVSFGAAMATGSYAADALRAVESLLGAAEDWRREREARGLTPLVLRFTVTAGTVVFGAIGDESRLEFTVIGDPVNLAVKLDAQARNDGVRALVTAEALDLARAQGYLPTRALDERRAVNVPGTAETRDLVAFVG
ncbi:adenylate/guanylate cyclase domain-containing protein [Oceanibacterium hippocampi]|uniref:Adenylate cyclase 1 n=1 Tax=Oceanibacterium hippocampi TaxID=745714 RepID=A0A1Y5RL60_9PROT|nr:adenylate/guanylate cyclase domain-containing protein [Oceanibacterium hippocampi]SLN20094.1 Adenylate cyclase 1 [Oceanibacterium hippocampi]